MPRLFDNGATQARAQAWAQWIVFTVAWAGAGWALGPSPGSRILLGGVLVVGSLLILRRRRGPKIPVLNYHSVSGDPSWMGIGDYVSLSPELFERQLRYLHRRGYTTLFVSDVQRMLAGTLPAEPGRKYVALTFDDGYADNWIAVLPLLKRYGMKGTFFVATDFIAEGTGCRPTWNAASPKAARDWSGYLSWPELRHMKQSGLAEIASHGAAHTRVFAGEEVCGFVGPARPNPWVLWNRHPERRRDWWQGLATDRSDWGHPVYRQAPALAARAVRPDPAAVRHVLAWAQDGGGRGVFERPDWETRVRAEWDGYVAAHGDRASYEGFGAYEERVEADLRGAKKTLEERLGGCVSALCWPENAFTEAGEQIARRVGYTVTVSNRHDVRNIPGQDAARMVRVFIGSHAAGVPNRTLDLVAFVLELRVFEGSYQWYPALAMLHAAKKGIFWLRRVIRWNRNDWLSLWQGPR